MIFKLYDCDFGVTINGVNYDFPHVDNLQIEDPETTNLTRGANAGNKIGIAYREGLKEPKTFTLTVLDIPVALFNLLKSAYTDKSRIDCYCVSRVDGSSKIAKNAVLSQMPQQLTLDESAESMNVALVIRSFDVTEIHKS